MTNEVERVLEESPSEHSPFEQSRAVLQQSDEPGWQLFFSRLSSIMQDIVANELRPRFDFKATMSSWAIRMKSPEDYAATDGVLTPLHSHLPSVLTSVFYLQVPKACIDTDHGGTVLRDPQSANTRAYRAPDVHIPPRPLRLAIFPAYIEHAPERPKTPSLDVDRIVVSTDLRVVHD